MLESILYYIVRYLAEAHSRLLTLNDHYELYFSDKQLHFWVIGVIGMLAIFAIHPLFTLLAKTDHILIISWIYVFTLILVLTFAIEIGQGWSGAGTMDFDDIVFGVCGFMMLFLIFAGVRWIIRGIIRLFR